jgi:hypothetical protein
MWKRSKNEDQHPMREVYVFFATNHHAKVNLEVDFVCKITNAVTGGGYEQIGINPGEENETLSSANNYNSSMQYKAKLLN